MKYCSNTSNELLLLSLSKYYKTSSQNIHNIIPIIYKTSHISLRLIDWFVTNYCKKYNIIFTKTNIYEEGEYFNVYSNYRSQLKAFKKIQFDPFRRRERIDFYYNSESFVETTIGQLNFFRWFIDNGLLDYVTNNYEDIEKDMLSNNEHEPVHNELLIIDEPFKDSSSKSKSTKSTKKKKRVNFSKSMIKQMTKYSGQATISFG
jgi:hypothetical protein